MNKIPCKKPISKRIPHHISCVIFPLILRAVLRRYDVDDYPYFRGDGSSMNQVGLAD